MNESKPTSVIWISSAVISTVSIIFSYYWIEFIANFSALYFAYDFDIPAYFNLSGLHFGIPDSDPLWSFDAAVTIYLSRPLTALIIGFGIFLISLRIKRKNLTTLLVSIWLNILGFHTALSLFVDDTISNTGVYQVTQLMHFNVIVVVVLAALSIYFMIIVGIMNGRMLFLSLPEHIMQPAKAKLKFLFFTFVVPWVALIILTVLQQPQASFEGEIMKNLSIVFILFPFLFTKKPDHEMFRIKTIYPLNYRDALISLLIFALLIVMLLMMQQDVYIVSQTL